MKKGFLLNHLGLGDHLICNGLVRAISSDFDLFVVPVKDNNYNSVSRMFSDLINVSVLPLVTANKENEMLVQAKTLELQGYQINKIGYYGNEFMSKRIRFDENFYLQLDIPFSNRWDNFHVPRSIQKEEQLYELLITEEARKNGYIFLHEDKNRGFLINRQLLPENMLIIEPMQVREDINFFDYLKIIENAKEIHCIESSFAALIESLKLDDKPKFAHRYARPEAFHDYKHEFTYKTKWTVHR